MSCGCGNRSFWLWKFQLRLPFKTTQTTEVPSKKVEKQHRLIQSHGKGATLCDPVVTIGGGGSLLIFLKGFHPQSHTQKSFLHTLYLVTCVVDMSPGSHLSMVENGTMPVLKKQWRCSCCDYIIALKRIPISQMMDFSQLSRIDSVAVVAGPRPRALRQPEGQGDHDLTHAQKLFAKARGEKLKTRRGSKRDLFVFKCQSPLKCPLKCPLKFRASPSVVSKKNAGAEFGSSQRLGPMGNRGAFRKIQREHGRQVAKAATFNARVLSGALPEPEKKGWILF